MSPVCTNCNGSDFVWANELKTGMTGASLALRARGEVPLGARICRTCGHAELFLRDISILHQPHTWRQGEFIPIVSKPVAKPAVHHVTHAAAPSPLAPEIAAPLAPPLAPPPPPPPAPAPTPMEPPTPELGTAGSASTGSVAEEAGSASEAGTVEPPAAKSKPARRRGSKSRA